MASQDEKVRAAKEAIKAVNASGSVDQRDRLQLLLRDLQNQMGQTGLTKESLQAGQSLMRPDEMSGKPSSVTIKGKPEIYNTNEKWEISKPKEMASVSSPKADENFAKKYYEDLQKKNTFISGQASQEPKQLLNTNTAQKQALVNESNQIKRQLIDSGELIDDVGARLPAGDPIASEIAKRRAIQAGKTGMEEASSVAKKLGRGLKAFVPGATLGAALMSGSNNASAGEALAEELMPDIMVPSESGPTKETEGYDLEHGRMPKELQLGPEELVARKKALETMRGR